ncbi:uncharacterized protein MYCFIDRAFT_88491 [Pseudocercospora fijiensis CIRAD86]|uniref:Early meiotic induction protein 1 n=1 Tax=Pseudocercospora fijiensis (strain CIRAD86) TaxID=383855 RepID=M2Z769_PSEFD|nr:uncharacterized protein MYCFIDRAFT_88491 [Pseudocercospora fijiensis CIRAD86]EME85635.1 hypothetical protein MYCFIDRAFT_88491 [Pseudocercospora fijiensis CIRAD86]
MGWFGLFGSDSNHEQSKSDTPSTSQSNVALTEEQRLRIFGRPGPAQTEHKTSRGHDDDAELNDLIKAFEASETPSSDQRSAPSAQVKAKAIPKQHSRLLPDGGLDISPEAVYPRTMSCRQQFDQAYYCQSLGGKFNDIYRYGHIKSCSEQWGAFWFCMRTRTLPDHEREEEIKNFYQKRDERRKAEHGSSEDIWEIRTRAVEKAFWKDPDDEGGGDVRARE